MEIDGSELAIRQDKGARSSTTITPPREATPSCDINDTPSPPKVTLVAADALREDQPWKPSPFHPGPSFKHLEWSADGTTVVAATTSKTILSYVLPTDLLTPPNDTASTDASSSQNHQQLRYHAIKPHGRLAFGTTPLSFCTAPYFSLATPWTQTVLVGCPDKPLQLFPLFPGSEDGVSDGIAAPTPIATYSLIKHETEAYMPPYALSWTAPGTHFVVGSNNLLALFDISRTSNDAPVLRVPTTSSLFSGAMYGLGVRGNVSALAATPAHSLTAAGTWTRGVGLYDLSRAGNLASHWNLRDAESTSYGGGGVVQLLWSPCGRYLVANERKSSGLLVYDVRGTHRLLATLTGRRNKTARPMRCTVYGSGDGDDSTFELWSGTDDGRVVMYENIGKHEGDMEPTFCWQAHDKGTSVASTVMHTSGSVLATCGTSPPVDFDDSESESDSSSASSDDDDEDDDEDDDDKDDEDEDDDDDRDDGSDDSDDNDESSDSDSTDADISFTTTRHPRPGLSDPSLKIWSLVPLQPV